MSAESRRRYWSERVRQLHPYVPGTQPRSLDVLKLNTNENPYPPAPGVIERLARVDAERLRRYPAPRSDALRRALASYHALPEACVFVGNGSDEVLAFAFMAFFDRPEPIERPETSYGFYPVYAEIFRVGMRALPLRDDHAVDIDAFDAAGDAGGIVFANPNAPTGMGCTREAIEILLRRFDRGVVLVDEAYADFGADSVIDLVARYPQLLVTRTFSKGRALAGMRIGAAFGDPALIEALDRVRDSFNSYPLDAVAEQAALASLADETYYRTRCAQIVASREAAAAAIRRRGFRVLPSQANFLFVQPPGNTAAALHAALENRGILVRHWTRPDLASWLRVTIGRDEEMARLFEALDAIPDRPPRNEVPGTS